MGTCQQNAGVHATGVEACSIICFELCLWQCRVCHGSESEMLFRWSTVCPGETSNNSLPTFIRYGGELQQLRHVCPAWSDVSILHRKADLSFRREYFA